MKNMFRAVLVGIDKYLDPLIPTLACATADARELGRLIEERIAPDEREVCMLLDGQATQRAIRTAIDDDLADRIEADDVIMLYFACHGCPERSSRSDRRSHYIIPHDAELSRIHGTAIDMERDLAGWLDRLSDAAVLTIVLDTCFSGAAGGRSIIGPILAANPALPAYFDDPRPTSLRGVDLGRGRVVLCGADDDELAREDLTAGHGVFTRHFIDALARARDGAAVVPLTTIYDEVEAAVREQTRDAQRPIVSAIRNRRASLPSLAARY